MSRFLKAAGIEWRPRLAKVDMETPAPLPRIAVARARPGFTHPAGPGDIAEILRFFGERCTYGLKRVDLAHAGAGPARNAVRFAELRLPGHVVLFEQPTVPWLLSGALPEDEMLKLRRAGAVVESRGNGLHTSVEWPGNTLRDFMLFDALMHEVGHHMLQHYAGKRRVRAARTRDHEAFAERFAARCREAFGAWSGSSR
ncbi:MAG: hypothetical protein HYY18_05605 [Planctomycetes bacterium]|nr:hypothetical protein [Planctomycetota bacterium]